MNEPSVSAVPYVRCEHLESTVVWRQYGADRRFLRECDECGAQVSWVKKTDPACAAAIPYRDIRENQIRNGQASWQIAQAARESAKQREANEWWSQYNAYLRTPEWAERRRKVIAREGGKCQGCAERQGTQVHHLSYDRVRRELLTDLVLLCDACHKIAHDKAGT